MIPVKLAEEPDDFDVKVRQKGLAALAELVGESPARPRPGPRRDAIAARREDLPASAFPPVWTDALDDLCKAYQRRCAYLAIRLPPAIGSLTVDHLIPKSRDWQQAYEWSNYRLCAAVVNAKKGTRTAHLDPFKIRAGWFGLELVTFGVVVGPAAPASRRRAVLATIDTLGLNQRDCCALREEYVADYQRGDLSLARLQSHAPFVAAELRRQGKLRRGDR